MVQQLRKSITTLAFLVSGATWAQAQAEFEILSLLRPDETEQLERWFQELSAGTKLNPGR